MAITYNFIADRRRDDEDNAERRDTWTFDADGTTDPIDWRGGQGTLQLAGSLGGGVLSVEYSGDLGTTFTKGHPDIDSDQGAAETISLNAGKIRLRLEASADASLTVILS